jgi:hypothetical protein
MQTLWPTSAIPGRLWTKGIKLCKQLHNNTSVTRELANDSKVQWPLKVWLGRFICLRQKDLSFHYLSILQGSRSHYAPKRLFINRSDFRCHWTRVLAFSRAVIEATDLCINGWSVRVPIVGLRALGLPDCFVTVYRLLQFSPETRTE